MAHGGGKEAIGKKPDRFSQAVIRVGRTYAQGLKNTIHEAKYPTPYGDTYTQASLIRRGKAKPIAFRNTSMSTLPKR